MPRRSKHALSVVPMRPGAVRPAAPEELDDEARAIWSEIVQALPANWFKAESLPLLRALVGHIVTSRELERRLRKDRMHFTLEDLRTVTTMQARETVCISRLSSALRLSQKSQYSPRVAQTNNEAKRARPWEIRSDGAAG